MINVVEEEDELEEDEEDEEDETSGVGLSSFVLRRSSMFSSLSHSPVFGIHLGRRLADEDGEEKEEEEERVEREERERNSGEEDHRD